MLRNVTRCSNAILYSGCKTGEDNTVWSLPAAYALTLFLKCPGKRMIPCTEQELASFRRTSENKLHGADESVPALCENLSEFLPARQNAWNREVVFTKKTPNLPACQDVPWIIKTAQSLP